MFTVQLKNLFFKQVISDTDLLLIDQKSTYVVLRYAHDIPTKIFNDAINFLISNINEVTDRRLMKFLNEYLTASGIGFEFTDEFDHSLEIVIGSTDEPFAECSISYDSEDD